MNWFHVCLYTDDFIYFSYLHFNGKVSFGNQKWNWGGAIDRDGPPTDDDRPSYSFVNIDKNNIAVVYSARAAITSFVTRHGM